MTPHPHRFERAGHFGDQAIDLTMAALHQKEGEPCAAMVTSANCSDCTGTQTHRYARRQREIDPRRHAVARQKIAIVHDPALGRKGAERDEQVVGGPVCRRPFDA